MSLSPKIKKIIEQLDRAKLSQQVKDMYSWSSLSVEDKECLLAEAEQRSIDPETPINFLFALYKMVDGKDPWNTLKVYALVIRRSDFPLRSKHVGLKQMRQTFNQIRETLSDADPTAVRRYKRYEASYYVLKAYVLIESEELSNALQSYQDALHIYQEYGPDERVSWVEQQITRLHGITSHLISPELLESKRLRLQAKLDTLAAKIEPQQQIFLKIQTSIRESQKARDRLLRQVESKEQELGDLEKKLQDGDVHLQGLNQQLYHWEAGLHFLMALPQAAMAPLWVEVVRLALEQGKIDELTRQALERLALHFPEDAGPLLAEVAARSPEPFAVDIAKFQANTTHWMALMAQARALKDQDLNAAAQLLVNAWDTLLASQERGE